MILEDMIKLIIKGSTLCREEVLEKIEDKRKNLKYFVNKLAASHLVARDLEIDFV